MKLNPDVKWADGNPVTTRMREGATADDYRLAPGGSVDAPFGSLAYDWQDKPHRLVYELAGEVKHLQQEIEHLRSATLQIGKRSLETHLRRDGDAR